MLAEETHLIRLPLKRLTTDGWRIKGQAREKQWRSQRKALTSWDLPKVCTDSSIHQQGKWELHTQGAFSSDEHLRGHGAHQQGLDPNQVRAVLTKDSKGWGNSSAGGVLPHKPGPRTMPAYLKTGRRCRPVKPVPERYGSNQSAKVDLRFPHACTHTCDHTHKHYKTTQ